MPLEIIGATDTTAPAPLGQITVIRYYERGARDLRDYYRLFELAGQEQFAVVPWTEKTKLEPMLMHDRRLPEGHKGFVAAHVRTGFVIGGSHAPSVSEAWALCQVQVELHWASCAVRIKNLPSLNSRIEA